MIGVKAFIVHRPTLRYTTQAKIIIGHRRNLEISELEVSTVIYKQSGPLETV